MVITDDELDALQGLPLGAQLIYIRELRRHADYATGVVGRSRRISWQGLREVLEVEPRPGIARDIPSKDQVRRLVDHLVRQGLVELVSDMAAKQLIMLLPMALTDKSVQKKPATNPPQTRHSKPATSPTGCEANNGAGFADFPNEYPPQNHTTENTEKPPHIRYPLDRDEMIGAGAQVGTDAGALPDEVGGAGGDLSAEPQLQFFRAVLGQDGAPTAGLMRALNRLKAVLASRSVSPDEMRLAVLTARERQAGDVAAYAVGVLAAGSLLAPAAGKVVPLSGRKAGKPTAGDLAAAALDMALAGMASGEVQHG